MANLERDTLRICLAALLHDIGKFWQRTGTQPKQLKELEAKEIGLSGAHAKWSYLFIKDYFLEYDIADIVLYHHNPEGCQDKEVQKLALIVQIADWLSSAERRDRSTEEPSGSPKTDPLISIFSQIKQGRTIPEELEKKDVPTAYHALVPLNAANLVPEMQKPNVSYKNHWDSFIREVCGGKEKIRELNFLLSGLEKYLWCIPQASWRSKPDISLYDHCRTTAALAVCISQQDLSFEQLKEIRENLKNQSDSPEYQPFLWLQGDLSGIQKYLFDVVSKYALRSLKGRSLIMDLFMRITAKYIVRSLKLPVTQILYCGGGNFSILVPTRMQKELDDLKQRIAGKVLSLFQGDLFLALDYIHLSPIDFMGQNFGSIWERALQATNKQKRIKYPREVLEQNYQQIFGPLDTGNVKFQTCHVCQVEIQGHEKYWDDLVVCERCDIYHELVKGLKGARYLNLQICERSSEFPGSFSDFFQIFGYKFSFQVNKSSSEGQGSEIYRIDSTQDLPFWFLPLGIPLKKGNIVDLDNLVERSDVQGAKMLGYLKMDVDSLGKIFKDGFGEYPTISRLATLSSTLDRFFTLYMSNYIAENYSGRLYLIFSGGDDTFCIGRWDDIIDFAMKINNEFWRFVARNPHLSLSAGIEFFKPKYPMIKASKQVEEALKTAKRRDEFKKRISLFGSPFRWSYVDQVNVTELRSRLEIDRFLKGLSEFSVIVYLKEIILILLEHPRFKGKFTRGLLQKIADSVVGLQPILEASQRGIIKIPRVYRFRYYLRNLLKEKNWLETELGTLVKLYDAIIYSNIFNENKGIPQIQDIQVIPAAVRWAELLTRKE